MEESILLILNEKERLLIHSERLLRVNWIYSISNVASLKIS